MASDLADDDGSNRESRAGGNFATERSYPPSSPPPHATGDPGDEPDFRALFEGAPVPILVLDPHYDIVAVSDAYLAATMTRRPEILGRGIFDVFPDNPDDLDADGVRNLRASLDRVRSTLRPDRMAVQKYDVRRPEEEGGGFEERHWSPSNSPVLGSDGQLRYILHRVEDVTSLVRMDRLERASRREGEEARRRLATIVEASVDAVTSERVDGTLTSWNPGAEELFGYRAEEVTDRPSDILVPADRREEWAQVVARLGRGERVPPFTTRRRRRDGSELPVSISVGPVRDEAGRVLGLAVITRDITEMLAAQAAVEAVQARLAAIVADSEDAILGWDLDGVVTSWNQAASRMLGPAPDEVLGRPVASLLPAEIAAEELERGRRVAAGARELPRATRWPRPDGIELDLSIALSPVRDGVGAVTGVSMIARDITALKRIERELAAAKEAAEAASRDLEAFSYSVAHDLRAPLRSIDGFSLAVLEDHGERLDEAGRRHLGFVREAAQRMGRLIDDLLALSRISRTPLNRQPVDLSALARGCWALIERAEPGWPGALEVADGLVADADHRLLSVVLTNLLGNARKFSARVAAPRVEVGRAVGPDGQPCFYVRDNGAGFDMAYVDKLFGVFQRLHSAHEFEGTGIGLATVQRVIHGHGGRVWAEGRVGQGATVSFTLPQRETP